MDKHLQQIFEYEVCCECGGDETDHNLVFLLGNPFAVCTRTKEQIEQWENS